jgi:hypothetical protein
MRFAYWAGGYWIARSSRAMTVRRGRLRKRTRVARVQRVGTADAVASRRWANNAIVLA